MKAIFMLLLSLATTYGATHVNISIAQQPVTNPADVTYIDGKAPAELKAGPAEKYGELKYAEDDRNIERSAQLKAANNDKTYEMRKMNNFSADDRPARVVEVKAENKNQMQVNDGSNIQFNNGRSPMKIGGRQHHARGYGRMSQRQRQFRPNTAQEKQNQEFERYIQSYHSGPTVETVFETSSPAPQRYQQSPSSFSSSSSASANSRPARIQMFERQVALPAEESKAQPTTETVAQAQVIVKSQVKPITELPQENTENKTPVVAKILPSYEPKQISSSNNYDQPSFVASNSYNNVNYNQPNYGYDQGPDNDFNNQYLPPSVDEPQGGYNDYYGQNGYYGSSNNDFYPQQPTYHRPVVTKTIQIAQPALKTRKFEIRHPAIQKEFYDIEERVLIRPAGTIVLELDHPVAKIPRGETILPLGHPHPAVASAYENNDGAIQHQISSSGSYDTGSDATDDPDFNNQQYNPNPIFNVKPQRDSNVPTLGSSITTTPSNNPLTKEATVEANLNRQATPNVFAGNKPIQTLDQDRYYITNDPQGNQRTIPSKHLSPKMFTQAEANFPYPTQVEVKNNGAPVASPAFNQQSSTDERQLFYPQNEQQQEVAFTPKQAEASLKDKESPNGQLNVKDDQDDEYKGEYLSDDYYNKPQDLKPARLRELPAHEGLGSHTHVIKHQHNINLPPAQHNIYLDHLEKNSVPNDRQQVTPVHISELRQYLQRHNGPVMVYATTRVRPSGRHRNVKEPKSFEESDRRRVQFGQLQNENEAGSKVQYSAPYSNMRYDPEQSSRLTNINNYENYENFKNFYPNKENLKLEENDDSVTNEKPIHENGYKTHIQIQVPHLPHEANKPIFVSSTISPPVYSDRSEKYRTALSSSNEYEQLSKDELAAALSNNEESRIANLEVAKPDCDQPIKHSARYENAPVRNNQYYYQQQPFNPGSNQQLSRIVEASDSKEIKEKQAKVPVTKVQPNDVDVSLKSSAGHVATPGSRVIAATPAPTDASAGSESFHKRRIVVNHPFQTVREVVEHEPITNYHQVQVNEPASPALYRLPYTQTNDAYHQSAATHSKLQYAVPSHLPTHGVPVNYNQN